MVPNGRTKAQRPLQLGSESAMAPHASSVTSLRPAIALPRLPRSALVQYKGDTTCCR